MNSKHSQTMPSLHSPSPTMQTTSESEFPDKFCDLYNAKPIAWANPFPKLPVEKLIPISGYLHGCPRNLE